MKKKEPMEMINVAFQLLFLNPRSTRMSICTTLCSESEAVDKHWQHCSGGHARVKAKSGVAFMGKDLWRRKFRWLGVDIAE
jgi:hypothetical protein